MPKYKTLKCELEETSPTRWFTAKKFEPKNCWKFKHLFTNPRAITLPKSRSFNEQISCEKAVSQVCFGAFCRCGRKSSKNQSSWQQHSRNQNKSHNGFIYLIVFIFLKWKSNGKQKPKTLLHYCLSFFLFQSRVWLERFLEEGEDELENPISLIAPPVSCGCQVVE